MAVISDINTLMQSAKCMDCIPPGMDLKVVIVLLQEIAGNTMTPSQLLAAAKCYICIPEGMQLPVLNYLADQIVNT